ncbi:uncharacterized protein RAG0_14045 [Rhynchosporium agropyri]|uniref:Polycomb protein VEFS-Box domain-containing protein n=1 Tax=Rhynchosporium agropyri TaxID=914238 RepID=A0A1E1LFA5_9HELO|nr:uncharacterized protein RAG0_14045 [Rhynchosporium agropyri]
MSHKKEVGDAALFVYNYLYTTNSRRPYLRRNVRKVLRALTMGSTLSSLRSSLGPETQNEITAMLDEEEEQYRPAKRRRLAPPSETASRCLDDGLGDREPLSQMSNGSRRGSNLFSATSNSIKPVIFQGEPQATKWTDDNCAKPSKTGRYIGKYLPQEPIYFAEAMRINVLEINAEYDEPQPMADWGEEAEVKCRCSIAIYYAKNDKNPGDVKLQDFEELCKENQFCTYRIIIGDNGEVSRKIFLPEPFVFTPKHFHVLRQPVVQGVRKSGRFDLADRYQIKVFIQPTETSQLWPAMRMVSASNVDEDVDFQCGEDVADEDVGFYAKTNPWFSSDRHKRCDLYARYKGKPQRIAFSLNLQIEWSMPNRLNEFALRSSDPIMAPILQPPSSRRSSVSPRKMEEHLPPESPGEGRAARRRSGVATYNLKALSSMSQGRSPRKGSPKKVQRTHFEELISEDRETTVKYCFGKAEAAETGIKRETTIPGLKCPFCFSRNRTLDELRLHFSTDHSTYKFSLRRPNPPRVTFFIEMVKTRRAGPIANISRTIQMGQPMTLFDLDQHLHGKDSWMHARSGPVHNKWPTHLLEKNLAYSSRSSSPHDSRRSSPNTPNESEDFMDIDKVDKHEATAATPQKQCRTHYVPDNIRHPLYDTVSKRLLSSNEILSTSDSDTDETWLHQARRDGINDFTDISPEEKEYINKFNPFVFSERLTSTKYIPDTMRRFARGNKDWLVEKVERRMEFSKHIESFVLRGEMDEETLERCVRILEAKGEESRQGSDGLGEERKGKEREKEYVDMKMEKVEQLLPTTGLFVVELNAPRGSTANPARYTSNDQLQDVGNAPSVTHERKEAGIRTLQYHSSTH